MVKQSMKFLLLLVASLSVTLAARAQLATDFVDTEQADVRLVSEASTIVPGDTFYVAFNFKLEPHWHVYWQNPGASGLALDIEWTLPEGFSAGKIIWPAPEKIMLGGLVNYGYEDAVTFLVPISVDPQLTIKSGEKVELKADAFWLICKEVCLPGEGSFALSIDLGETRVASDAQPVFESARASLPLDQVPWEVAGYIEGDDLVLGLTGDSIPSELYFYVGQEGMIDPNGEQVLSFAGASTAELRMPLTDVFLSEPLDELSGVLQSGEQDWAISFQPQETKSMAAPAGGAVVVTQEEEGFEAFFLQLGLPGWLVLAYLGGLILNVMPCVLPVLSLKVFSLLKQSGQTKSQALLHGVAYTVGVVASFLALAGLLFALRAFGERIGWGFQLQSPGFVVVLTLVFFLFALNLMGVFELGASLVGADAKVAKRSGLTGSFGMGILAAVVGAPCVGPLLASVGGIAVQAPPVTGLLIFGMMGFGLASPFLILAIFPKLVAYLPKPGAWMESVKQFMGFLLLAAVVFLAYVAGASGGTDAILGLLIAILISGVAAWIYGRWAAPVRSRKSRRWATVLACLSLALGLGYGVRAVKGAYDAYAETPTTSEDGAWAEWSSDRVESELAEGHPVFVDFTATWCLICQVNKKVALRTEATEALFKEAGVVTLEADWTRYDPAITDALESFDRNGVPLYVLYSPNGSVQVLPQSLTNGIIREAVEKMDQ